MYDWNVISTPDREIGHAALLLSGTKPGTVLLWRWDSANTTLRSFVFERGNPWNLKVIPQTLAAVS